MYSGALPVVWVGVEIKPPLAIASCRIAGLAGDLKTMFLQPYNYYQYNMWLCQLAGGWNPHPVTELPIYVYADARNSSSNNLNYSPFYPYNRVQISTISDSLSYLTKEFKPMLFTISALFYILPLFLLLSMTPVVNALPFLYPAPLSRNGSVGVGQILSPGGTGGNPSTLNNTQLEQLEQVIKGCNNQLSSTYPFALHSDLPLLTSY
jgi:hypothetical protein